ncbi:MAG: GWxTD domain-containing protein [Gemmatimonadales bacterium]|nr:GWxTD domain-containing protein [Gemmatimonadales bacterium]MDQ3427799.1 GWxTD domain-containing protein [Gemmatimonadota bacterium]
MDRLAIVLLLSVALGCGSWRRVGTQDEPTPAETLTRVFNTTQFYQRLGRLAAAEPLPFVGTVAFAAGPADSVIGVLGLSLENRALAFQREGNVFVARYRVSLSFQREGVPPVDLVREEIVRVPTFQETQRSDESVLFQQVLRVLPGTYTVTVALRDAASTSESSATADFIAPSFAPGSYTAPILAYQATGRGSLADPLSLVLNPRGAVGYGSDTLLAYIEGYGFTEARTIPFEVRDEQQRVIFRDELRFRGGRPVESQVIRLSPDSVSLGELRVSVGNEPDQRSVSALVSFTQAWVVTNFEEMLDLLRYFGHDNRLGQMRRAPPAERARLWREFYTETDPNDITPENEALNQYFSRVQAANQRFTDEGVAGWRTDRGEVLINLGAPDESVENTPGAASRIVRWTYLSYRLEIYFQDETGFGRLRLSPGSRAEYERVLSRLRRQS